MELTDADSCKKSRSQARKYFQEYIFIFIYVRMHSVSDFQRLRDIVDRGCQYVFIFGVHDDVPVSQSEIETGAR